MGKVTFRDLDPEAKEYSQTGWRVQLGSRFRGSGRVPSINEALGFPEGPEEDQAQAERNADPEKSEDASVDPVDDDE